MIAETRVWEEGPFRVVQRPRFDNPSFAVYIVFRGALLVGKSFSLPDLGCCLWLERHAGNVYATVSTKRRGYSARGNAALRQQARVRRLREIA